MTDDFDFLALPDEATEYHGDQNILTPEDYEALYATLSYKQQLFIDFFRGNKTKAAEKAGYSTPRQSGYMNMKNSTIVNLIYYRRNYKMNKDIATAEQLDRFWTAMVNDASLPNKDRLKASRYLGESHAQFVRTTKIEGSVGIGVGEASPEMQEKLDELYE